MPIYSEDQGHAVCSILFSGSGEKINEREKM